MGSMMLFEREYIKALTQNGPAHYIDNALVEMRAAALDDHILPIVIAGSKEGNADACSPYTHYVRYTLEEIIKRNRKVPQWMFKAVIKPFGAILKMCGIDHVVYLNNCLFATNPVQLLTSEQVRRITTHLIKAYPNRAIVHPNVNPYLHKPYFEALRDNGYRMIKSRKIYLLDLRSERFLERTNARQDLNLLKRTPYDVIDAESLSNEDCARMAELYRSLYLDKHSYLNLQLNREFFILTVRNNFFVYRAFKKNGRIDAFVCYFVRDGVLTGAFLGYDRNLPSKLGLYRQVIAILIRDAQEKGLMLNLSAGCGEFKELRGGFPAVEYYAVFSRHLSLRRRFAWNLVQKEGEAWSLGF